MALCSSTSASIFRNGIARMWPGSSPDEQRWQHHAQRVAVLADADRSDLPVDRLCAQTSTRILARWSPPNGDELCRGLGTCLSHSPADTYTSELWSRRFSASGVALGNEQLLDTQVRRQALHFAIKSYRSERHRLDRRPLPRGVENRYELRRLRQCQDARCDRARRAGRAPLCALAPLNCCGRPQLAYNPVTNRTLAVWSNNGIAGRLYQNGNDAGHIYRPGDTRLAFRSTLQPAHRLSSPDAGLAAALRSSHQQHVETVLPRTQSDGTELLGGETPSFTYSSNPIGSTDPGLSLATLSATGRVSLRGAPRSDELCG